MCVGVWLAGCRSGFCSGLAILELVSQCHTGQSALGGLCSLLGLAHSRHSANICPVNCSAPPNLEGYLKERACRGDEGVLRIQPVSGTLLRTFTLFMVQVRTGGLRLGGLDQLGREEIPITTTPVD